MTRRSTVVVLLPIVLLFAGCPGILGPEDEGDAGNGGSTEPVQREQLDELSFDFSTAEALITTAVGSIGTSGLRASQTSSDSPLLALTEGGELTDVFSVPDDVSLPPVEFVAVSPTEEAIFVCFDGAFEADGRSMHFLKLYEDGSFEVLEEQPQVLEFDAAWEGQQEPVAFDSDGGIFYVVQNETTQELVKFSSGQRRVLSPNFELEIQRFFSDGTNLFYLGRNRSGANDALYMKVVTPGPEIDDIFYRADGEAWVKNTFLHNGSLVLSGWQIPDPRVADREYTGILELSRQEGGGFSWTQVYGGAATGGDRADRLSLQRAQFTRDDGTINQELVGAIAGQFFAGGSLPATFDYQALLDAQVDLDASGYEFRPEIVFWRELLDGETNLEPDAFTWLNAVKSMYLPPFLGYTDESGVNGTLNEFVFNVLFAEDQESTIPIHEEITTGQEFNDFLAHYSALNEYFVSIALRETDALPYSLMYIEGNGLDDLGEPIPTDYARFKTFLDTHFDYELTGDTDLSSTLDIDDTVLGDETNDIYGIWSAFIGTNGPYPGRGSQGSRVSVRYPYRSAFLSGDGTPDSEAIRKVLRKYYPAARVEDPRDGAYVDTNSSSNKAAYIESAFTLGQPRYDYAGLTDATLFDTYTTDPYQSDNLRTLFDSFDTLSLFTIAGDGSYYGVFEQGGANMHKVVRMMNGDGVVDESVVISDIEGTAFAATGNNIAWVRPTDSAVSEVLVLDVTSAQAEPITVVGADEGLEIFDFALSDRLNTVTFAAWNESEQRSYVGRGDLLTETFTLLDAANLSSESSITVY